LRASGFEQIWRAFAQVEEAENLADWQVAGVYLWPILRDRLMREVAEQLGVYQKRQDVSASVAAASVSAPTEFQLAPSGYAVMPFVRRNSDGIDPFSVEIIRSLEAAGAKPLVFGVGPEDFGSGRPQVEHLERLFFNRHRLAAKMRVAPSVLPIFGGAKHIAKHARVIAFLEKALPQSAFETASSGTLSGGSIAGRFKPFPRWLLVEFVAHRTGWKALFQKAGVKKLFVVNAWKRALIAGAQAAGVWVVEPQHGLLSNRHPLLAWPNRKTVAYLPNELLLWGDYWAQETDLPKSVLPTIIGEPKSLSNLREKTAAGTRVAGTVLVVSQAQQTTQILDIALRAADANPGLVFTLKPHPQELKSQFADHLTSVGRSLPANLHLASPLESAFDLIAASEFVVGVHSMALVEALALGAKVVAVALPGYENIESIAILGDLILAPIDSDLRSELGQATLAQNPGYYFAPALAPEFFTALLLSERQ
jgi:hypothetical protein